ncbi:MAG: heme exporter protein CcmB [Burkholderiales bacterium]|nr:heme exporter protein CcmB [Burkholderiales bacterium]
MAALLTVAQRDLTLALRNKSDAANVLLFFVIVASLFPLGVGPDPDALRAMGPGVLWVAALLASLLGMGRLFAADYADGTLEQLALAPQPLALAVAAKIAAHWLTAGLPLVVISPLIGVQYGLGGEALLALAASLAIGTPVLSLVGAIGAALTLGVRTASMLAPLITLPLTVPALVFGAGAVDAAASGLGAGANLSLLAALLALALFFAPWAAAAAVRIAME